METDEFEWDDGKADANYRKHGVDFWTAALAFDDPAGLGDVDDTEDYRELRFRLLGRVGEDILFVVYVERGDRIRIISARQATRREHDRYYRENAQD